LVSLRKDGTGGYIPCIPRGRRCSALARLPEARGVLRAVGHHNTYAFHDPEGSKQVGLIVEIPDFAAFQELMQSEAAAEAMKYDGVHPETLVILNEG
jgi:hypothetical protein